MIAMVFRSVYKIYYFCKRRVKRVKTNIMSEDEVPGIEEEGNIFILRFNIAH